MGRGGEVKRLKFPEHTKRELYQAVLKALSETLPSDDIEAQAERFFKYFEGIANDYAQDGTDAAPRAQQRKEKLEAFANAFDKMLDAMSNVDRLALGHALMQGMRKATEQDAPPHLPDSHAYQKLQAAQDGGLGELLELRLGTGAQGAYRRYLSDFSLGIRQSISTLPDLDRTVRNENFQIACWLLDLFGSMQLPFTTSDTGLAGKVFSATLTLAGRNPPRAGYWLRMAASNRDRMDRFTK